MEVKLPEMNQGKCVLHELCVILYGTMALLMKHTTIQFHFFKPQSSLNIVLKRLAEKMSQRGRFNQEIALKLLAVPTLAESEKHYFLG
jgi:hypothetical protein